MFIHPELKEGEEFLCNANLESYRDIKFKTKRRGVMIYNQDGTPIQSPIFSTLSVFPVFVKKEELKKKG